MEIFLQTTFIKIKKNYLILLYLDKIKFIKNFYHFIIIFIVIL